MKYAIVIATTITLIAALALSGCDTQSNKLERAETSVIESNRDLEIAKTEVEAEWRIYRSENSNRIVEYNRTIEDIKQQISNEPDSAVRARHEARLAEHEATHRDLKREMDNYKVSGRDNWDKFQDSFSERMDDLGDSLNDFFSSSRTTSSRN
jgi:hypothetical protein